MIDSNSTRCKANGCPLDVEFITHWEKNDDGRSMPKWGVCRYHRAADPAEWGIVTQRCQRYQKIITLVVGLATMKEPVFMIQLDEPFSEWLERSEKSLRDLINGRDDPVDASANFEKIIQLLSN